MKKRLIAVAIVGLSLSPNLVPDFTPIMLADELQQRVETALATHPGGTQVSDDTIEWESGAIQLTFPGGSSTQTIGSCSTGKYCAWSSTGYTGTKLTFTSCTSAGASNSLLALGTVRSAANARLSGTVQLRIGTTPIYTMGASSGLSATSGALTTIVCFS